MPTIPWTREQSIPCITLPLGGTRLGVGEGLKIVKPRPVRENAEASHDSPPCEHDLTGESEALIGME